MFKRGDIIVGTKASDGRFVVTTSEAKMKVLEVDRWKREMRVRVLSHSWKPYIGHEYNVVNDAKFFLYKHFDNRQVVS
jgi:archaeosine-15-forming tRNA-guanine transglycosylase